MTSSTLLSPEPRVDSKTRGRSAGLTAIAGALVMLMGTVFWALSGADLEAALSDGTMGEYLTDAAAAGTTLTLNLSFWILGVLTMGAGGLLLSRLGAQNSTATTIARGAFVVGPAAAVVFFSLWLGIVLGLAPAHVAGTPVGATALALGHAVSVADWVATVLILSVGGGSLAVAGRGIWVPRWLQVWAGLTVLAGVVAIVGLIVGGRATVSIVVVPVGVTYLIAAGVAAVRHDG